MRAWIVPLAFVISAGCVKPDPPKITPKTATVTAVTIAGLDVALTFDAENPNSIDLDAQNVSAKVVLDGSYDMGTVSIPTTVHLPAKKTVEMTVPMHASWVNLAALLPLAQKSQNIPFTVDGKVKVGGALAIEVPFHLAGWLTRDQLLKIATNALPKIPGLPF